MVVVVNAQSFRGLIAKLLVGAMRFCGFRGLTLQPRVIPLSFPVMSYTYWKESRVAFEVQMGCSTIKSYK